MHGKKFLVNEALFGSDGSHFYLRLDFEPRYERELAGMEVRLTVQSLDGARTCRVALAFSDGAARVTEGRAECSFVRILEARMALADAGITPGDGLRFQLSLWQGGLPMDAIPQQGWIEMRTTDPVEMAG